MFTARKMGKAFFTNSGSEANDSQVRLLEELMISCTNYNVDGNKFGDLSNILFIKKGSNHTYKICFC
jgi:acetylornithine/succinyldiaminopimelate/putrescine aminotransferase